MEPIKKIENEIVRLAEYLLATSGLSAASNFLDAGGDSLTATLLAGAIERELGIKCTGAQVLGAANLSVLANSLADNGEKASCAGLQPQHKSIAPASPQQRRLYAEYGKDPTATNYNQPLLARLPGQIDLVKLKASWFALLERHTVLRTAVRYSNDQIVQHVVSAKEADIIELEMNQPIDAVMAEFVTPFDLGTYPLWRIGLCRAQDAYYLLFDIHHIITDGFSLQRLFAEWSALYQGENLPAQEIQYTDYADWIAGEPGEAMLASQHAFWKETLTPLPAPVNLPTDFKRIGTRSNQGNQITFDIGAQQTAGLRTLAKQHGVTLFSVLLSAYSLWLYEATGAHDFVVGTPAAGRSVAGSEVCQGMFVNTVCLRFKIAHGRTASSYIKSVASDAMRAFEHQDYPFDELVKKFDQRRDFTRNPIFDTMIALQNVAFNEKRFLGEAVLWRPAATGGTLFDLNLQIEEQQEMLCATWMYSTELFQEATVDAFRHGLLKVVDRLLAGEFSIGKYAALEDETALATLPSINFNF